MIDFKTAHEYLDYSPETGLFFWKISPARRINIGDRAGSEMGGGYRAIWIRGMRYAEHRLAWFMRNSEWPDGEIDHIDGNPNNNCIDNLRVVCPQENQRNRRINKNNNSGVTGVFWNQRVLVWQAFITVDYKNNHLGYFKEWWDAVCARKAADYKFGFHPNHGRMLNRESLQEQEK